MQPLTSEQLHFHLKTQQVFFILSGIAGFESNDISYKISQGESLHVPPKALHKIFNEQLAELEFLVISEPESHGDRFEIVEFSDQWKDAIKILNVEWLEKYFAVEPIDVIQLSNPREEIIEKGGMIFYIKHEDKIIGTYSLLKNNDEEYELGKMAVSASFQGKGIGNILLVHCFIIAKKMGIKKLILFSNTKLVSAIHLYKKFGFREIPIIDNHYERSNVKMEKLI